MQCRIIITVMSLAPTAAVTVSTSTWLYIGLGLVGTLLVAGIAIGAAIRIDKMCCTRRDSSETGSEMEEQGPKQQAHVVGQQGEDMKSFNIVPLEEAADPDLILLTNGKCYFACNLLSYWIRGCFCKLQKEHTLFSQYSYRCIWITDIGFEQTNIGNPS